MGTELYCYPQISIKDFFAVLELILEIDLHRSGFKTTLVIAKDI
jgi:hypothetical protein